LYRERLLRLRPSKEIEYPEVVIEETIESTDKGYMPDEALMEEVAKEAEKRAEDITDTEKEFQMGEKVGVYFVIMHIDKEKWPVTFGCDEVFAVIPEIPENLRKRIVQLKKRSRKRKIVNPNLSGTF
jgi:hypothetical protein